MPDQNSKEIADAIQAQISTVLGSEIGTGFVVIRYPSGYPYTIRYGTSAYWNPSTLALVDELCAAPGDGTATMEGAQFSTLYGKVLASTDFVTSKADLAAQARAMSTLQGLQSEMIAAFEADMGPITAAQIAQMGSVPPSKAQYVDDYVKTKFHGTVPPSMAVFGAKYSSWLTLSAEVTRPAAQREEALGLLQACKDHVTHPNAANGALQTGATSWAVPYDGLPGDNDILAQLTSKKRAMTVSVTLENTGGDTLGVTLNKLRLNPVAEDALTIRLTDRKTGMTQSLKSLWAEASKVEMDIAYPGLAVISAHPLPLSPDQKTGWYSVDALTQIQSKTGKDETGFHLSGSTYSVTSLFAPGHRLSRVQTFVISKDPTITLKFHTKTTNTLLDRFTADVRPEIQLGNIAVFGGPGSDYGVKQPKQAGNVITVVIEPEPPSGTVDALDLRAHIIGGVLDQPP